MFLITNEIIISTINGGKNMQGNVMSFKAKINNLSKEKKVAPQAVLQVYMLERLLERIAISQYKDNFILKGGMLISAILGMSSRSTMDMDTTVKGFELTEENATKILNEICAIELDDDITFKMNKIELKYHFIFRINNSLSISSIDSYQYNNSQHNNKNTKQNVFSNQNRTLSNSTVSSPKHSIFLYFL